MPRLFSVWRKRNFSNFTLLNRREAENILQQIVKLAPDLYPGKEAARMLAELPAAAQAK